MWIIPIEARYLYAWLTVMQAENKKKEHGISDITMMLIAAGILAVVAIAIFTTFGDRLKGRADAIPLA